MKHIFIFAILLYQKTFSVFITMALGSPSICRFSPSCSEYAKESIMKHGVIKGGYVSTLRILSCQPWNLKVQSVKRKIIAQSQKQINFKF